MMRFRMFKRPKSRIQQIRELQARVQQLEDRRSELLDVCNEFEEAFNDAQNRWCQVCDLVGADPDGSIGAFRDEQTYRRFTNAGLL